MRVEVEQKEMSTEVARYRANAPSGAMKSRFEPWKWTGSLAQPCAFFKSHRIRDQFPVAKIGGSIDRAGEFGADRFRPMRVLTHQLCGGGRQGIVF
jgi:hypothetical protein